MASSASASAAAATTPPAYAYVQDLNKAAALLKGAARVAVFTGAGMSADSGVSTFRKDPGSLWSGVTGGLLLAAYGTPLGWRLTPGLAWSKVRQRSFERGVDERADD